MNDNRRAAAIAAATATIRNKMAGLEGHSAAMMLRRLAADSDPLVASFAQQRLDLEAATGAVAANEAEIERLGRMTGGVGPRPVAAKAKIAELEQANAELRLKAIRTSERGHQVALSEAIAASEEADKRAARAAAIREAAEVQADTIVAARDQALVDTLARKLANGRE